jgi:hypothetical protein
VVLEKTDATLSADEARVISKGNFKKDRREERCFAGSFVSAFLLERIPSGHDLARWNWKNDPLGTVLGTGNCSFKTSISSTAICFVTVCGTWMCSSSVRPTCINYC